ncbi:MAG: hypothetical protein PHN56_00955 [Candidatus Nanoarchaeia archaeon]|nr:hypothetical protein [Candidatus Nanoarchaeia archaeon]
MQYKTIIMGLVMLILLAGCTQTNSSEIESINTETSCPPGQEICVLGAPGLLNELSIYSDSSTTFSVILRNNLAGDEARNVEVKLKNLSPFYVVEGYNIKLGTNQLSCSLSTGIWEPSDIRSSLFVPEPQFISDLNKPFASKMLDIMYPNEEVEFLWSLNTPSRQEIANVAYEHSIDYEVSYDYKSSILQTIYAISEQEYQRVLSLNEDISTRKGTITSSIGALNIESNVEEPIRVSGVNSQFSLTYNINNKRSGIPLNPAIFVFQYPNGTDFVGAFSGKNSLDYYGYIDMKAAYDFYETYEDSEKLICLPDDFDKYDTTISRFYSNSAQIKDDICITYDEMVDYIIRNFNDLSFNRTSPNIVLKFLYPINLLNEINYLYFPMVTTENIDISKYYSFRLKTKYRYSFSGTDDIIIIPSEVFYTPTVQSESVSFFGDMGFNLENTADSYALSGETLNMEKDKYLINSSVFDLGNDDFLQLVRLKSNMPLLTQECSQDSDCPLIIPNVYCNEKCYYTEKVQDAQGTGFTFGANALPAVTYLVDKDDFILKSEDLTVDYCENSAKNLILFYDLLKGNFSLEIHSGTKINRLSLLNSLGEKISYISVIPNYLVANTFNCSKNLLGEYIHENILVINSTADDSSIIIYDMALVNDSDILLESNGGLVNFKGDAGEVTVPTSSVSSIYYNLIFTEKGASVSTTIADVNYIKDDVLNHYVNYRVIFGDGLIAKINNNKNTLSLKSDFSYLPVSIIAQEAGEDVSLLYNNTNSYEKDMLVFFKNDNTAESDINKIYKITYTSTNKLLELPYYYNIKIGYSPRETFLKKVYENTKDYISLDKDTFYVNHLPYSVKNYNATLRGSEESHNLVLSGEDTSKKLDNITKFIDYKSFFELNEINLLNEEAGLSNIFSDSDLIGYQLKDYDYTTPSYTNIIPESMKLMSYYEDESVYFNKIEVDGNEFTLVILYSDKLTLSTDRFMYYLIDSNPKGNSPIRANYFNISLIQATNVNSKIVLGSTFVPVTVIKKDSYEQQSSLMDLKAISGVADCSTNYNQFYQEINEKPVLKVDYLIKYGGNVYDPLSYSQTTGSIIIGDYDSIEEIETELKIQLSDSTTRVKGVVSICKV